MASSEDRLPRIGVVVVTYRAESFVADCLESVLGTQYPSLRIVVVDNDSPDGTVAAVREWAKSPTYRPRDDWPLAGHVSLKRPIDLAEVFGDSSPATAAATVTLVQTGANLGFAGGVNAGLRLLLSDPDVDLFWVLNPDMVVDPSAPFAFADKAQAMGRFGLIGGRILFLESPDRIQIDAGRIHPLAGTAISVNIGQPAATTSLPAEQDIDFISGASMVASRDFIDRAGLLDESYFLYFEEIDWQLRRGDLPLGLAPGAKVLHRAGASIGSAGKSLKPSGLSAYFTSRNLLRFVWRWSPWKLPIAYLMTFARLMRHSDGTLEQAVAVLRGLHRLSPPASVRARLPGENWTRILAR